MKQASSAKLEKVHLAHETKMSLSDQLRIQLHDNHVTVTELFKSWDADGSGSIARDEFHEGLHRLGYDATAETIDVVFESFDVDHGGELEFLELKRALQRSAAEVEKELRLKNAEMRARIKSAGAKTDTHTPRSQPSSKPGSRRPSRSSTPAQPRAPAAARPMQHTPLGGSSSDLRQPGSLEGALSGSSLPSVAFSSDLEVFAAAPIAALTAELAATEEGEMMARIELERTRADAVALQLSLERRMADLQKDFDEMESDARSKIITLDADLVSSRQAVADWARRADAHRETLEAAAATQGAELRASRDEATACRSQVCHLPRSPALPWPSMTFSHMPTSPTGPSSLKWSQSFRRQSSGSRCRQLTTRRCTRRL